MSRTPTLRLLGRLAKSLFLRAGYVQNDYSLVVPPDRPNAGDTIRIASDREQIEWVAQTALTPGPHGHLPEDIYGLVAIINDIASQAGGGVSQADFDEVKQELEKVIVLLNAQSVKRRVFARQWQNNDTIFYCNNNETRSITYNQNNNASLFVGSNFKAPVAGRYRVQFNCIHWEGQGNKAYQLDLWGAEQFLNPIYVNGVPDYNYSGGGYTVTLGKDAQIAFAFTARAVNMQIRRPMMEVELMEELY